MKKNVLVNVAGALFIAFCFWTVAAHLRFLSGSVRPGAARIVAELDGVVERIPGEKTASVEVFNQKATYVSADVEINAIAGPPRVGILVGRMAEIGWSRVSPSAGSMATFCKDDLVADLSQARSNGRYRVQVVWGNADAVCR